jgi:hypothetical protein
MPLTLAAAAALLHMSAAGRQTVSLDLDWRFHHVKPGQEEGALLGKLVEEQTCVASRFAPMKREGCKGLTRVYPGGSVLGQGWYNTGPGSINEDTCRSICCANNAECAVWNWCPKESEGGCKVPGGGQSAAANGTCWIGWSNDWNASASTCRTAGGWVGGTRRVPQHEPVFTPADRAVGAAGREYNDTAWSLKSLPHDFVVEGTPDMLNGDKSTGTFRKELVGTAASLHSPWRTRSSTSRSSSVAHTVTQWSLSTAILLAGTSRATLPSRSRSPPTTFTTARARPTSLPSA